MISPQKSGPTYQVSIVGVGLLFEEKGHTELNTAELMGVVLKIYRFLPTGGLYINFYPYR